MKITKRLREEAALIAAVQASTPLIAGSSFDTAKALGYRGTTWRLAQLAHSFASDAIPMEQWFRRKAEIYAEAEAMLRCGWTP